ncbi:Leucine zipper protein 2 [Characodon lateralis]|uniref:Leucine zipper protein 2 n=1 Tax=Characodon lateralis TaxID=208331 RepID=A0ABU7EAD3_9TELE|nr:Leucine zipper protein 2 [Characodon lateralis]
MQYGKLCLCCGKKIVLFVLFQSLKNDESVAKKEVQRILELSHKQRDEMKSLQAALQKQLDEANERAEKQQATIKFLKVEMEKKTKIIKDLQQEVDIFVSLNNG